MENETNIVPPAPSVRYNKLAIIAFISSIVGAISFILGTYFLGYKPLAYGGPLLQVAAFVMGIVALFQIKGTSQKGKAFAILAMVGIILWPMILGFIFGFIGLARPSSKIITIADRIQADAISDFNLNPDDCNLRNKIQDVGYSNFLGYFSHDLNGDGVEDYIARFHEICGQEVRDSLYNTHVYIYRTEPNGGFTNIGKLEGYMTLLITKTDGYNDIRLEVNTSSGDVQKKAVWDSASSSYKIAL